MSLFPAHDDVARKIAEFKQDIVGTTAVTATKPDAPMICAKAKAWELVDWPINSYRPSLEGRLATVSSARGCLQQCLFCSQQKFWARSWPGRDPAKFVDELEKLHGELHRATGHFFHDSTS